MGGETAVPYEGHSSISSRPLVVGDWVSIITATDSYVEVEVIAKVFEKVGLKSVKPVFLDCCNVRVGQDLYCLFLVTADSLDID